MRIDCKKVALCGTKSACHCHFYWKDDKECQSCTLVRRKPRLKSNQTKTCSICGKEYTLTHFYGRYIKNKAGEKIKYHTAICKLCISEIRRKKYQQKNERSQ